MKMDGNCLKICRLCLKSLDEIFDILENFRIKMLNIVIGVDMFTGIDQIICHECSDILQKCYDFKMVCLNTEDYVKTFANVNEQIKISLEDVCFKELSKDTEEYEKQKICRLCLNWGSGYYANLEDEFDGRPLHDLLLNCLPELNFDLTNEPSVCSSCVDQLKGQFIFSLDFMEVQRKIKMYQDLQSDNSLGTVDLHSVLEFSQKLKIEDDIKIEIVKLENTTSLYENASLKVEPKYESNDDFLELNYKEELKHEDISENEDFGQEQQKMCIPDRDETIDNYILEQGNCSRCTYTTTCISTMKDHMMLHKNTQEFQDNSNYNTRLSSHQKRHIVDNNDRRLLHVLRCIKCPYKTNRKDSLIRHIQYKHIECSKLQQYKCANCSYETKLKVELTRHMIVHKDRSQLQMHKCTHCSYEAKRKDNLVQHIQRRHTESSQLQMYKCANCSYETKLKVYLQKHMIVHQLQIYKCTYCSYVTKRKDYLVQHVRCKHMESSELQLYKCANCSYETKLKDYLKRHMVVHKDPSQLQMYKCTYCSYESRSKYRLEKHLIVHKNPVPSEPQIHKCTVCSFESKNKYCLKRHNIIHKDPNELQMFKCIYCSFETKLKGNLVQHIRCKHTESHELQLFKCTNCPYETRLKIYLKRHMFVHKDPSELKMFKCTYCSYEAKKKYYLRKHLMVHKDPSELQMFKCIYCSYETKYKFHLSFHMILHKDPSEVQLYTCTYCSYETKYKSNLVKHIKCKHAV